MMATLGAPAFGAIVWGVIVLVLALFVYEVYVLLLDSGGTDSSR